MPRIPTLKPRVQFARQKIQSHYVERDRSWAFKKARERYLSDNPLCMYCEADGRVTAACILEHRVPLWQGGAMWSEANWAASCKPCADAKTAREARERLAGVPK